MRTIQLQSKNNRQRDQVDVTNTHVNNRTISSFDQLHYSGTINFKYQFFKYLINQVTMNDKTYYTVGTVPKSNRDIIEQEPKSISLAHICNEESNSCQR